MRRRSSLYDKISTKRREKQNEFFTVLKVLNDMFTYRRRQSLQKIS